MFLFGLYLIRSGACCFFITTMILATVTWAGTVTFVIEVEIACPGFVDPAGGTLALAYHAPAYERAVKDANQIYADIFNFTLTLITWKGVKVMTAADTQVDNAENYLAAWYYGGDRDLDSVAAVISPGWLYISNNLFCLRFIF